MKNSLIIFLIILIGCHQSERQVYTCSAWSPGDNVSYNVELTEVDAIDDSITNAKKSLYVAEISVTEMGERNIITWKHMIPLKKPDAQINDLDDIISDTIYKQELTIVYQINDVGQYQEILNWNDISKQIDSSWQSALSTYDLDSSENMENLKKIEKAFLNRSAIEAKLTRDIMALHLLYGQTFFEESEKSELEIAGIGDQPISSMVQNEILNDFEDHVILRITQKLDSDKIMNQVSDMVEYLTDESFSNNQEISITDTCLVDFDKKTNWPLHGYSGDTDPSIRAC